MSLPSARIPLNDPTVNTNSAYPDLSAGLIMVVYIKEGTSYVPHIITTNNRGSYSIRSNGKNQEEESILSTAGRETDEEFYKSSALFTTSEVKLEEDLGVAGEEMQAQLAGAAWCLAIAPNVRDGREYPYTTAFTVLQGKRFESKADADEAIAQVNALASLLTPFGTALFNYMLAAQKKLPGVDAKYDQVKATYEKIMAFMQKPAKSQLEQITAAKLEKLVDLSALAAEFKKFVEDQNPVKNTKPLISLVDMYTECSNFAVVPSRLALARVLLGNACKKAAKQLEKRDPAKVDAEEKTAADAQIKALKSLAVVGAGDIIQFLLGTDKKSKAAGDPSYHFSHETADHVAFIQNACGLSDADYRMLYECARSETFTAAQVREILTATDGAGVASEVLLTALAAGGKLAKGLSFSLEIPPTRAALAATETATAVAVSSPAIAPPH